MKKYFSHNNNNASSYLTRSKIIDNHQHKLLNSSSSHSLYNSQTLDVIRSIVDELYQINNQEISSPNESKEKHVRFSLEDENDQVESFILNDSQLKSNPTGTSIKYQPVLSDSTTVVCCLIKGRSKVDRSVSTNDLPSLQCECATQTIDIEISSACSNSFTQREKSNITWISSRPTINYNPSLTSITSHTTLNHSLYPCENNHIVQSLNTAHQLIIPSKAKHYDICIEQTLENYAELINDNIPNSISVSEEIIKLDHDASLAKDNRIISEENMKFCTCSKRKLFDNHFPMTEFIFPNQSKLLEELHLSKRSLQLMHNDGLVYIHDLVLICLRNMSQFYQILIKQYHLSKNQANLFVKIMNKWWKNHRTDLIDINKNLSKTHIPLR